MASPTPHAPTPRRQCPRCGGARQRRLLCVATTTPQSRHGRAQGRRLLRVTLRHLSVGSRFSLKQRPRFLCGGMASAQGFLSTWRLEPTAIPEEVDRVVVSSPAPPKVLVLLQTGPRHQARGPLALAPRTSRRATALLHAPCSSIRAPNLVLRRDGSPDSAAASGRRAGFRWQTTTAGGLSHSKPKNSSHAT